MSETNEKISTISTEVEVNDFLSLLAGMEDAPVEAVLKLFGGRIKIIGILIHYFIKNPENLNDRNTYDTFKQILFSVSGNETYEEDWDILWDKLKFLNIQIIVKLLEEHTPKRRHEKTEDAALRYLLEKRFFKTNIAMLTEHNIIIYNEIKDLFEVEPEALKLFRKKKFFVDKVLEFKEDDLKIIYDNYSEYKFETDEILEILKNSVESFKIDTTEKLSIFLNLVRFYAPINSFDRKYRDAFILEIYEAHPDEGWNETMLALWQDEFYNVKFNTICSAEVKDQIQDRNSEEAKHIGDMNKKYPNYRHD